MIDRDACNGSEKMVYALNLKILLDIKPSYAISDRTSEACFGVASDMIIKILRAGAIGHEVIKYYQLEYSNELVIRIK